LPGKYVQGRSPIWHPFTQHGLRPSLPTAVHADGAHEPAERLAREPVMALDLNATTVGYLSELGPRLRQEFQRENILLRPLANTIYVMPPYCVTGQELDLVHDAIARAADLALH
jgi:adenosylmethionine-8-amino-7-oxononanoate aminotransferase